MARWDQSTPQRATAWHGIRMVRNLNSDYLIPLKPNFPVHRLSAEGDGPKVGCATCHKGTYKPLYGQSMLADYQSLAGVGLAGPAPAAPLPEGASPLPEGAAPSPKDGEAPPPDGAVPSPAPTAKKAAAKPSN
jgi:photosynthetic reaction center cytochrome c subunit